MIFDTHCHVYPEEYNEEYVDILRTCFDAGIVLNNIGTNKKTSAEAVGTLDLFPDHLFATVGLHPSCVVIENEDYEPKFDYGYYKLLAQNPRVIGIGECGLDYYHLPEDGTAAAVRELQQPIFEMQLNLGRELDKTLVIHCRPQKDSQDAYEDLADILEEKLATLITLPRFVIHSFTGTPELCRRFVAIGGYIGLNGIITFDKTGNSSAVIKDCPLERIVLETDAPYLSPAPLRGKRNVPQNAALVAEFIGNVLNKPASEIEDVTAQNAQKLFQL